MSNDGQWARAYNTKVTNVTDVDRIVKYFKIRADEAMTLFEYELAKYNLSVAEDALIDYNWYRHVATLIKGRFWE